MHRYHPITTQIVVPKKLRAQLLSEFHDSLMGSHQSFDQVYQAIRLFIGHVCMKTYIDNTSSEAPTFELKLRLTTQLAILIAKSSMLL